MSIAIKRYPKCYSLTVAAGSSYGGANLTTFPDVCGFLQISNQTNQDVSVKLNGDSQAVFTLPSLSTQVFDWLDLTIYSVDFANTASGAIDVDIEMIAGLQP